MNRYEIHWDSNKQDSIINCNSKVRAAQVDMIPRMTLIWSKARVWQLCFGSNSLRGTCMILSKVHDLKYVLLLPSWPTMRLAPDVRVKYVATRNASRKIMFRVSWIHPYSFRRSVGRFLIGMAIMHCRRKWSTKQSETAELLPTICLGRV